MTEPIAIIDFTDGTRRPVFEDAGGQYVVDDDGRPVCGVWWLPVEADPPFIVETDS